MKYGDLNLGQIEAMVNKLGGMDGVRRLLSGQAVVNIIKHVIDLDADPFIPDGWKVEEHKKGGQFEWDPAKVRLFLSEHQKDGKVIGGNDLRKEMAKKPAFNANLLDYLLANPSLIPEDWKGKAVFFWDTIYRYSDGNLLHVRFLYRDGKGWDWNYVWLGSDWNDDNPAAVPASN